MPFRLPCHLRIGLAAAFLLFAPGSLLPAMAVAADAAPERLTAPKRPAASEIVQADDLSTILAIAQGYGEAELSSIDQGDPVIVGEINGVAYQLFFLDCTDAHTACKVLNFYAIWDAQDVAIDDINAFNRTHPFHKSYLTADALPVVELNLSTIGGMTRGQLDHAFERWTIVLAEFPRTVLGGKR